MHVETLTVLPGYHGEIWQPTLIRVLKETRVFREQIGVWQKVLSETIF